MQVRSVNAYRSLLVDCATELGCDAIMLPPPPRHRLRRMLGRDRASAIRRLASCPVVQPR
jgi:hypothetical protein